jgi:hypothetical protein
MASAAVRKLRAQKAALTRHHPDQPDLTEPLGRELKAARTEDYIKRVVAEAPLLTQSQRDQLAVLLKGSAA